MSQLYVRDLMTSDPISIGPRATLHEVTKIMQDRHVRHVPVVAEDARLVGLISQRDVLRSQEGTISGEPASSQGEMDRWIEAQWMMTREVQTVQPDTPALDAALALREHAYGCLPVVEDGALVGIITESDFVEHAIRTLSDPSS